MVSTAKKCGISFQPPAIFLIYENDTKGRRGQHIAPVQNFSKFSGCNKAAKQLKNKPQHKSYLEQVSLRQLEMLFVFFYKVTSGSSLAEKKIEHIPQETTIDFEEDLNKPDDKKLAKRKRVMDELYEKIRRMIYILFRTSKLSSHKMNDCSPVARTQGQLTSSDTKTKNLLG